MFAPTMMHAIGLVYLFGNQGLVTNLLGVHVPIYGAVGIILAQIIYVFPQSFQILYISLSSTDYRLYEASNTMGISKIREFISITIPSIKYFNKFCIRIVYIMFYRFWSSKGDRRRV